MKAFREKKVIDPSKPFENPKLEIMARARAAGSSKVDAYRKAYPSAKYDSARALSSVIERSGVDLRALQILATQGMTEGDLFKSLVECVRSSDERIKLDSTKHALTMIGYGKEHKDSNASYNPTAIIINIVHDKTQPIDSVEVKSNDAT